MTTAELVIPFKPLGAIRELGWLTDPEIVIEGPAGTGKTFGICHLLHRLCLENEGLRILMIRKTLVSLTDTALVTLREKVLTPNDPCQWFGGSRFEPASLRYDNGSRIVVGGMDNAAKFLSGEYDVIYANELWELNLEDYETLLTRLRNGKLGAQRFIGDTNPTYDRHWMYQRPSIRWLKSRHEDNPTLTQQYLDTLRNLTGNRYQRFYLGQRVGIENSIYGAALDQDKQLVEIPDRTGWTGRAIGGMDFGRIHYSAVVAVTEAMDGKLWVRECWTGGNDKERIMDTARRFGRLYGVRNGVTDPLQDWAAQDLGWKIAKSGAGSRKGRIQRVLGLLENDMLRFDCWGEGIQALWDELVMYRYEIHETSTAIDDVVVRKDDDRVAALEYAIEAWETSTKFTVPPSVRFPHGNAQRTPGTGFRPA